MIRSRFPNVDADSAISTLDTLFEWKSDVLSGTFHEQFMEFLVARLFIDACLSRTEPYPDFMKLVVRPEINRYFRDIYFTLSNSDKEKIYQAISIQYFNHVGQQDMDSILIRVHSIYHMCRLQSNDRLNQLKRAFNSENDRSVLLSLYFGTIKLGGMLDKEEEFYSFLQKPENSKANRGYHLKYYNDSIKNDTFPYEDDGMTEWGGTLKAIEKHFESNKIEHFRLRRIELYTMKEFLVARENVYPLNKEKMEKFQKLINESSFSEKKEFEEYVVKIQNEYNDLAKEFDKYYGASQ